MALLAVAVLGYPFYMLFNHMYFYGIVEGPSFIDTTVIFIALCLLSYVLLGNNRLRTLIASSFIFSIINLAQIPVLYFLAIFVHPVTDLTNLMEDSIKFPLLYYNAIFFINIIITVCCLLAARWLRNTKSKPPLSLYVPFTLLFIFSTLIFLFWLEDILKVMSMSLLSSFFMGTLLIAILIFLFYLYTRLSQDNLLSVMKNTENQILTVKNDKYTPFIQQLSRRELEVIEAILAGCNSYKEIAASLNISVHTVKKHLRHIYQITGTPNTAAVSNLFNGYSSSYPKSTP